MSLLTIGTAAFDAIETPFGKTDKIIGGAAMYISWAASYFTDDIRMVSIVGEDFPESELTELKGRGINTDGIEIVKGGKSFFWSGKYHNNMNSRDTLITDLNVLADFDPIIPEKFANSRYVMLGNLTPDIQQKVIDQLSQKPRLIALDTMNFWMDHTMESLLKVLKNIDLLMINDEEARQLSGEYSLVKAANKIHDMGPRFLIIKKGEHGALLFGENKMFYAPAIPLAEVFDPTGAGDTFAGGVMGYLAKTDDISFVNLKKAVIHGSALASFCVEKFGLNRLKELDEASINKRIAQFKELVHF